jgi:gamma-glutamyltranspeptidase/glutathione hydrolase
VNPRAPTTTPPHHPTGGTTNTAIPTNPPPPARPGRRAGAAVLALAVFLVAGAGPLPRATAAAPQGAAATVHPRATRAALDAFERGGNAVDAAVAAALMLGVVDGQNSGLGGGCFALVRRADGRFVALDGRETAPGKASRDLFVRDGKAVPELSQAGPLAAGVPGELAALEQLARRHGRLPLRDALREAAEVAEEGFAVTRHYAGRLKNEAAVVRRFPEAARILLHADGTPLGEGEILRQPDLARTYRAIADHGVRWFYRGPYAAATEAWMRVHGGLLERRDFARYRPRFREPVVSDYRGWQVVGFPPPSSGGVHVAQILNILGNFDLAGQGPDSAGFVHLTAEAMKLAFADRAYWLGDADFVPVPRGLVSREYGAELARRIDPRRATAVMGEGIPPAAWSEVFGEGGGRHTTHLTTADAEGNWVALTATVNTTFGSKVVIPGTGVFLNNQMDDFTAQPGATNYFGLPGAEANAVAPGKRPLSSMSPTLVLRNGRPAFTVGAAGGPTIISQVVLAILQTIDFGRSPDDALARPRFHQQWRPDELVLEEGWPDDVSAELQRRGHHVRRTRSLGAAQALGAGGGGLDPAADPRAGGTAGTWPDPGSE